MQVREHSDSRACVEDTSLYEEIDSDIGIYLVIEYDGNHQTCTEHEDSLKDVQLADRGTCVEDASRHGKIDLDVKDHGVQRPSSPCQNVVLNQPLGKALKDVGTVSLHFDSSRL